MPDKKSSEEDMNRKVMQAQILQANLQMLRERAQKIVEHYQELDNTKRALEDLGKTKNSEALVPVGSGSYVKGSVSDTSKVIVSIGANIAVKKSGADAVKLMEERMDEAQRILGEIVEQEQSLAAQLQRLQPELQDMASQGN
ncbi:MAG: prefoldin subunit alpha [Candidatus Aenigmarchaeota archaeon]|nr:prefoldin subunit alpha [Candidatus Aenigmarchaeota archaeon]